MPKAIGLVLLFRALSIAPQTEPPTTPLCGRAGGRALYKG